jgi:hypothetical protein
MPMTKVKDTLKILGDEDGIHYNQRAYFSSIPIEKAKPQDYIL